MRSDTVGAVYLLHFHKPYKHAQHYIGFALDVGARVAEHRAGNSSKLIQAITKAGISFDLAKVWLNVDRHFERKLKRRGSAKRICPICRGDTP